MGVIKENMEFETYNDFYIRRKLIKASFDKLDSNCRDIYKLYLYANRLLSTMKVDLIWEYLSEPYNSIDRPSEEDMEKYYNKGSDKI